MWKKLLTNVKVFDKMSKLLVRAAWFFYKTDREWSLARHEGLKEKFFKKGYWQMQKHLIRYQKCSREWVQRQRTGGEIGKGMPRRLVFESKEWVERWLGTEAEEIKIFKKVEEIKIFKKVVDKQKQLWYSNQVAAESINKTKAAQTTAFLVPWQINSNATLKDS